MKEETFPWVSLSLDILFIHKSATGPGGRIHRLHPYRGVISSSTSILDMTLNNLTVRLQ